jgi:hypothetical protein
MSQHYDEKLKEAREIIQEMKYAMNSGLGCSVRDFLGQELYNRIDMFLYGSVEDEEEEKEPEGRTCSGCGMSGLQWDDICGCQR